MKKYSVKFKDKVGNEIVKSYEGIDLSDAMEYANQFASIYDLTVISIVPIP